MPVINSKHQITLPKTLCEQLKIAPGDQLSIFVHAGQITLMKMVEGSGWGVLQHIKAKPDCTDDESLRDAIEHPGLP